ncbi:MAG: hypothetical protein KDA86_15985 [Planctomycetaceae bacterium]|nr:hypothetical protein [Planctomycetaceae bacterium]
MKPMHDILWNLRQFADRVERMTFSHDRLLRRLQTVRMNAAEKLQARRMIHRRYHQQLRQLRRMFTEQVSAARRQSVSPVNLDSPNQTDIPLED